MDFLFSHSQPSERVGQRYSTTHRIGPLWVGCSSSGNLTVIEREKEVVAVVVGSLFGPLAEGQGLKDQSPTDLGHAALSSEGSFAVVIPRGDEIVLVTDAGGSIPVYYGHGPNGVAVGTLVHHVASGSGEASLDPVSVVDYLINGTICYPFSWYSDVRMAPPGSVCTFTRDGVDCQAYWEPTEPENVYGAVDEREWGNRLRQQVEGAIDLAIADKSEGRVLYSGGSDSRAILSLLPESFSCTPTIVLDRKNREYRLAERSARLLGRTLEWVARPEGFYRSLIYERIDGLGPGWDFRHTHIFGPVADRFEDTDVVLGGYAADSLFKSYYMSNVEERRRQPPRLLGPRPEWIQHPDVWGGIMGNAALWNELIAAAQERHIKHHERLKEHRPQTAGNWHALWPVAGLRAYAGYLACLRLSPRIVEPFLFHQSYRLAARMPDPCRVDRRAFRHAFAKEKGGAGLWPTSGGRIPRLGGYPGSLTAYYLDQWREWKERLGWISGPQGSWPPDHEGWHPVRPETHFSEDRQALLRRRLNELLTDGQVQKFFHSEDLSHKMQVRALALGFDVEAAMER